MNKSTILAIQHVAGLVIDGVAGAKTKQAILDFQKSNGLVADGIVGTKTIEALDKRLSEIESTPLNEAVFFSHLRVALFKSFTQSQVDGIKAKLAVISDLPITYQAYILATSYHETAHTMQPIAEYGKGKNYRYGKWFAQGGEVVGHRNGSRQTYRKADYPHLYYGRGDVQLTWLDNYLRAGKEIGVDLANNPGLALNPEISAKIMKQGMIQGWFTGKALRHYMTRSSADYAGARRIINGVDKKDLIAGYAVIFETALRFAKSS